MQRRRTRIRRLVRTVERHNRALKRTQLKLAAATRPEDGAHITDPKLRWAEDLIAERTRALTDPDIIGYGIGQRHRKDVPLDEVVLTVLVKKKLTHPALRKQKKKALPRYLKRGSRRLRVDVVELGKLKRYTTLSQSIGPRTPAEVGTLGAIAVDNFTNLQVALTAMHVSGQRLLPRPGAPPVMLFVPSPGEAGSTLYGRIIAGTMDGIDGCKIELGTPNGTIPSIPFIGPVRGWRPVRVPGDRGLPVRMFGASSKLQAGFVHTPLVALPQFGLRAAILVQMSATFGDSGAALVDQTNLVLGFLVGQAGSLQVFCAAGEMLRALNCDIPTVQG